jgi:hypothetical protein
MFALRLGAQAAPFCAGRGGGVRIHD